MKEYRIYKTVVSNYVREDLYQLVKSYGCDGRHHMVSYGLVFFDDNGVAFSTEATNIKPKHIGTCKHNKECKFLGVFAV